MPWLRLLPILLAAAPAAHAEALQGAPASPESRTARVDAAEALRGLDQFVAETMGQWQVPGVAISIVKDGEVVFSRGFGVRDPATRAPMTEDTMFLVASIAKTFTSFGAGLLVDEGKLDLDRPVRAYLPQFALDGPVATWETTLRDLLAHRSGFQETGWLLEDMSLTREQVMERLPHLSLSAPIRTRFLYSNIGFGIVAHAIDQAAGMPWERFTERRIFEPLNMTRSTAQREIVERDRNRMRGVIWWQGRYVPTDMPEIPHAAASAGRLFSTADDLARWMLVHLSEGRFDGRQIIAADTLDRIHSMNTAETGEEDPNYTSTGYALGWHTAMFRGETMLEHGGNHWGVSTHMALLPRLGLGVTVLTNQDSSRYPEAVIRSVFDRFLGEAVHDWSGQMLVEHRTRQEAKDANPQRQAAERTLGTNPSRPLSAYAGTYRHPGYGPVAVRLDGGRLSVEALGQKAPLIHWQYDVFATDSPDHLGFWNQSGWRTRMSFVTSPQGRVSEVRISNAPGVSFLRQED